MADKKRLLRRKAERVQEELAERPINAELLGFAIGLMVGDDKPDRETARLLIRDKWLETEAKLGHKLMSLTIYAETDEDLLMMRASGLVMERRTFFEDGDNE